MAAMPYRSVATTDIIGPDYGPTATSSDGTIYVIIGELVARSDRWPRPNPADIEAMCCIAEKVEQYRERDGFNGPSRRSKQKPPLHKRVARRRRRTALAKHHRKVMKLAAKGVKSFPKRPAKPRG